MADGPMSWDDAVAATCGPGGPFEITTADVRGTPTKVFAATPPSLRTVVDGARARGDDLFLVYEDERRTFAEVTAEIDALGVALVERYGITPGDRVAIAMRNYPEWVIAFAATTSIGAIAVCCNAWWTGAELRYGLADSGAAVLVADVERAERAQPHLDALGVAGIVVRAGHETPAGFDRWEDVVILGAALPDCAIDPDDDAMILYTSGTTGDPKGAVSTHRAVLSALVAFGCRARINALVAGPKTERHPWRTSFILVVPLFHVTGLVPVMLSCLAGGHKLVMQYKWSPERALELIERERVTTFVGVPTQSWDMVASDAFSQHDTSSLLTVGGGGAPAPPELVARVESSFSKGRPTIGYGMTETNSYGPGNVGDDYVARPRSSGRCVPIMEIAVRDEHGVDVPTGEVGEIWFSGPTLIRGYWNKPDATAEAIVDGWLRSGDLGRLDEEGFIYVEDRLKDMVLRGGENIYCAEVEAVIYQHPAVHEAAVFGVPHDRLGEEVAVAVLPRAGMVLDAEELRAHVATQLASFKVPSHVLIVDEPLPRNASGKILKRQLKAELVEALEAD